MASPKQTAAERVAFASTEEVDYYDAAEEEDMLSSPVEGGGREPSVAERAKSLAMDRFRASPSLTVSLPPKKQQAIAIYAMPFLIGIGALQYIMAFETQPLLVLKLVCEEAGFNDVTKCDTMTKVVADELALLNSYSGFSALAVVGTLGAMSDRFGRKKIILIPMLGLMFSSFCYTAVALLEPDSWRPVLALGNIVYGLSGEFPMLVAVLYAIAADCSQPVQRHFIFTLLEAAYGVGGMLGGLAGGYLFGYGDAIPYVVQSFTGVLMLVCLYFLPETLPMRERTRSLDPKTANTVASLTSLFRPPKSMNRSATTTKQLFTTVMAFALFVFSNLGFNSVAVLYLKLAQNFTNQDVGLYVALQNGVRPLAPLMLYPFKDWVSKSYHTKARTQQITCFGVCLVMFFTPFVNSKGVIMLFGFLLGITTSIPFGFARGMMSACVPANQQAFMLAGVAAMQAVIMLVAPVMSTELYGATSGSFRALTFWVNTLFCFANVLVLGYLFYLPEVTEVEVATRKDDLEQRLNQALYQQELEKDEFPDLKSIEAAGLDA